MCFIINFYFGGAVYRNPGSSALYIGRWDYVGYYWLGPISNIKVYDRALSDKEVYFLYNKDLNE